MTDDIQRAARQALALLDLTSLNDNDTDAAIESLCRRVKTPAGTPAAVCVYPAFVTTARRTLKALDLEGKVKVATVTNFPHGGDDIMAAARATREAVASGADEVDVVFPWRALIAGDEESGRELVACCHQACGNATLKVILETGELKDPALIRRAAELALEGGADFLKTSTGKVAVDTTLEAAEILLTVMRERGPGLERPIGFKAAGGVRTTEEAQAYLQLAERIMGAGWITPKHFRFGSSDLLDDLLITLGMAGAPAGGAA